MPPPQSSAPPSAPVVAYQGVSVRRGSIAIVDDVSLTVPAGSFVALTGASGAGKTTLLRLANRLIRPDAGSVRIMGADIADADPAELRRGIGYAIQGIGLFPHWTVADNIAAVPWLQQRDKAWRARRVATLLDLVELPQSFADSLPAPAVGRPGQPRRPRPGARRRAEAAAAR